MATKKSNTPYCSFTEGESDDLQMEIMHIRSLIKLIDQDQNASTEVITCGTLLLERVERIEKITERSFARRTPSKRAEF